MEASGGLSEYKNCTRGAVGHVTPRGISLRNTCLYSYMTDTGWIVTERRMSHIVAHDNGDVRKQHYWYQVEKGLEGKRGFPPT